MYKWFEREVLEDAVSYYGFMWWLVGEWRECSVRDRGMICVGYGCSICGVGLVVGGLVGREVRE